jgi:hypothetical protein
MEIFFFETFQKYYLSPLKRMALIILGPKTGLPVFMGDIVGESQAKINCKT